MSGLEKLGLCWLIIGVGIGFGGHSDNVLRVVFFGAVAGIGLVFFLLAGREDK